MFLRFSGVENRGGSSAPSIPQMLRILVGTPLSELPKGREHSRRYSKCTNGLASQTTTFADGSMTLTPGDLHSADDVRQFIHEKLCQKENLVSQQFKLTEIELKKRGETCGFQYLLQGPRSVKLAAVWACDTNVIYLYDATGERFGKVQLRTRIDFASPESAAA